MCPKLWACANNPCVLCFHSVPNATFASRRTGVATTCSAITASTTSAGCVSATGGLTGLNTTSALGTYWGELSRYLTRLYCRYKENPNIVNESVHAQAREALKKYLHYFERVRRESRERRYHFIWLFQWENHSRSLKLEAVTLEKIKNRITVSSHECWSL